MIPCFIHGNGNNYHNNQRLQNKATFYEADRFQLGTLWIIFGHKIELRVGINLTLYSII